MRSVTGAATFYAPDGGAVSIPVVLKKCQDSLDAVLTLEDGSTMVSGAVAGEREFLVALFGEGESAAATDETAV